MTKTATYTISFENGHWRARTPGAIGAAGSRSLTSLQRQLKELASFTHGDDETEPVELVFVYELPDDLAPALREAEAEAALVDEHEQRRLRALSLAAKQLIGAGLSEREAGLVMGLSGQRVHQLKQLAS